MLSLVHAVYIICYTRAFFLSQVGKVLLVEVSTSIPYLTSASGFFVRPTRRTREWGKAEVAPSKATFYIADTGQFSVEFASAEFWREEAAFAFDALMLFVNPELEVPAAGFVSILSKG